MPLALAARRWSALWRWAGTVAVAALGPALASAAYLWIGATTAALAGGLGFFGAVFALGALYSTRRPMRFKGVYASMGVLALLFLYAVGGLAVRDVAMTMAGTDTEAVVAKTRTARSKGATRYYCTLRRTDGAPVSRELSDCEGRDPGDVIPVVLDPEDRFPPVGGTKEDLPTTGELQATAVAGLLVLLSAAIGSPPRRE